MPHRVLTLAAPQADLRIRWGLEESQFGDLWLPSGRGPHAVVIAIHGGFWRDAYDLNHLGHLCAALREAGMAAWSLEYRRLGQPGGGWPGTFQDVLHGARHLAGAASAHHLDLNRVGAMGHSAGGQLALWMLAEQPLRLRGAVALAAVSDLRLAWELELSRGVVSELMGGAPADRDREYALASPSDRLPLGHPVRLLHGGDDDIVPAEFSHRYAAAARLHGDDAEVTLLPGAGHFELIDPASREWPVVLHNICHLLGA